MKATWIPVGSAVAIILLSLGVLEVMSAGVRSTSLGPAARWFSDAPINSELTPDDLLALDLGPETGETPTDTSVEFLNWLTWSAVMVARRI
jgi:hypothetical protein